MVRFKPFSIWYTVEDNQLIVHLSGRNEDKTKGYYRLHGTEPFFYTEDDVNAESIGAVRVERNASVNMAGRPVHRVVVKYPFQVPKIRELLNTHYEADVIYENRIRYQYGIKDVIEVPNKTDLDPSDIVPSTGSIEPRVVVFDIETMDKNGESDAKYPTAPVVSIALWDSYTDRYVCILNGSLSDTDSDAAMKFFQEKNWKVQIICVNSEKELFEKIKLYMEKVSPDIYCGWYSRGFDIPYLIERAKTQGYPEVNWRQYEHLDIMYGYARMHEGALDSKKLDYVSKEEGFEGKNTKEKTWQLYQYNRSTLVSYNCNDVFLTKSIMLKKNIHNFFCELAGFAGISVGQLWPESSSKMSEGRLIDGYVFHKLKGRIVRPSKNYGREENEEFSGGLAIEPVRGIYRNVIEIDNTGEYAAIIRTWNMSPETIVDDSYTGLVCVAPSGTKYRQEPRGVMPIILDELVSHRDTLKKTHKRLRKEGHIEDAKNVEEKELVVKQFILSFFGVLSNRYNRDYVPRIASDITDIGRQHLLYNKNFVENYHTVLKNQNLYATPAKIISGFTDSCQFYFPEEPNLTTEECRKRGEDIVKRLNKQYNKWVEQFGIDSTYLSKYGDVDGEGNRRVYLAVKLEDVYYGFIQKAADNNSRGGYFCMYDDPNGNIQYEGRRFSTKHRGFEMRRSDSAPITKIVQEKTLESLLIGKTKESVCKYLQDVVNDLKTGKIPITECRLPKAIKKEDYTKTTPQHIKAALWSNKFLGKNFKAGDKPCIYHGSFPNKPPTDVFALDWNDPMPPDAVIDWGKTIDRVILSPLDSIFTIMEINPQDAIRPLHRAEDFF